MYSTTVSALWKNSQRCSLWGHRAGRCFAFGAPKTCGSTDSKQIGEGETDRKETGKRMGKLYSMWGITFLEFGSKNFLKNVIIMNFHNPLPMALSFFRVSREVICFQVQQLLDSKAFVFLT